MSDKESLPSFRPFLMIMFYNGIDFTPFTHFRHYVCLLFRLKSLLLFIYFVIVSLMYSIDVKTLYDESLFKYQNNLNLYGISYHIRCWAVLISFVYFVHNSDQIKSILIEVESRLSAASKRRMFIVNCILMVVSSLTSISTALILSIMSIIEGQNTHKIIRDLCIFQFMI